MSALDRRVPGPIHRIGTKAHPAAKRGKWPVPNTGCVAVVHWIEVDVIEVQRKIVLFTQSMLPLSPLPNPQLAFGTTAGPDPFAGANHAKSRF